MLQRFKKTIVLGSTMDANKAAAVKCAAQEYIKHEIVKSGGQFSMNNRALWKIDGQGGAGNGTGMGPYEIAYACIVHNPTADADDRYPDASLWSRTLPVDGLIFENDVKKTDYTIRMLNQLSCWTAMTRTSTSSKSRGRWQVKTASLQQSLPWTSLQPSPPKRIRSPLS